MEFWLDCGVDYFRVDSAHQIMEQVHDKPDWPRRRAKYYGPNLDKFHIPLNLILVSQPWKASAVYRAAEDIEAAIAIARFGGNRLAEKIDSAKLVRLGDRRLREDSL